MTTRERIEQVCRATGMGFMQAKSHLEQRDYLARRDAAWNRYANHPHADPLVGREEYRAEIARIEGEEK